MNETKVNQIINQYLDHYDYLTGPKHSELMKWYFASHAKRVLSFKEGDEATEI